ncbi:restriction endonuclease subunit S [Endozoicomonas euniceicola]|uniref:Restriction endonuclease subunit S n=1 Tax=Endozoicomonas euniceicola TaxID=1234143 RepID=A0ABY6GTS1_9GAMM|nr:restriction endonuclease subunit S [Endozoicomonas euniceicola]UYM16176.1 restriction endonuclease subunit S [Endozoicomonas euniceicola]
MTDWHNHTIDKLVRNNILAPPMDGNHGEIHPKSSDFTDCGIPFVMASDIYNGVINFNDCKYIKKEQADRLRKGFAKEGDVLLTHKASIGRTAIVPKTNFPYIMLTPQVTYYRVLDKTVLDNKFLKYYFDFAPFQETLGLLAGSGSTRAYLGIMGQRNLSIRIPKIKVQREIAEILSVIDAKIELNNRINTELEAMAKTLYDYWFVQFDFPDANGKPYKSSGGKMVYNEVLKREIPEGWDNGSLWSIAKYFNGLAMQKYRPKGDDYLPVIKIREMSDGITGKSEKACPNIPSNAVVSDGDILFSWSATLDVKIWSQGKGALNQHIFKVTSDNFPKVFYYFELLNYLSHFKMIAEKRKTTMGHITLDHLKQANICIPPMYLLEKIQDKISPIFEKHLILEKENRKLAELRDWLLPMLMNGQVTVNPTTENP